ncbi:hypothetical protein HDU93_003565 [Gonapodya sp. JEL0774]|nr:hypothetical protein HDU93_003565 [Gonapodya sp. JEL0774]
MYFAVGSATEVQLDVRLSPTRPRRQFEGRSSIRRRESFLKIPSSTADLSSTHETDEKPVAPPIPLRAPPAEPQSPPTQSQSATGPPRIPLLDTRRLETEEQQFLVRRSPSGAHFLIISDCEVQVWKASPLVLVGSVQRDSQSLETFGTNVDAVWRPPRQQPHFHPQETQNSRTSDSSAPSLENEDEDRTPDVGKDSSDDAVRAPASKSIGSSFWSWVWGTSEGDDGVQGEKGSKPLAARTGGDDQAPEDWSSEFLAEEWEDSEFVEQFAVLVDLPIASLKSGHLPNREVLSERALEFTLGFSDRKSDARAAGPHGAGEGLGVLNSAIFISGWWELPDLISVEDVAAPKEKGSCPEQHSRLSASQITAISSTAGDIVIATSSVRLAGQLGREENRMPTFFELPFSRPLLDIATLNLTAPVISKTSNSEQPHIEVTHISPLLLPSHLSYVSTSFAYVLGLSTMEAIIALPPPNVIRGSDRRITRTDERSHWLFWRLAHGATFEEHEHISAIEVNEVFGVVAVGRDSGLVTTYQVPRQLPAYVFQADTFHRELGANGVLIPLATYRPVSTKLSPTTPHAGGLLHPLNSVTLAFTGDGCALAIGWERSGIQVVSVFGKDRNSGSVQMGDEYFDKRSSSETYMKGVMDLFWDASSTTLFAVPSINTLPTSNTYVQRWPLCGVPFAKLAATNPPNMESTASANTHAKYLVLSGRSYILLGTTGLEVDVSKLAKSRNRRGSQSNRLRLDNTFQQIDIPLAYSTFCLPISVVAVCPFPVGSHVAVAGTYGLAIYNIEQRKWRLFVKEKHEKSFKVEGGLAWLCIRPLKVDRTLGGQSGTVGSAVLIAGCFDFETNTYSLRFFNPDANLDLTACLHTEQLLSRVVAMHARNHSVLVLTADGVLRHYLILVSHGGQSKDGGLVGKALSIHVQIFSETSILPIIAWPERVRAICWYPVSFESRLSASTLDRSPLLILDGSQLIYLAPQQAEPGRPHERQITATLLSNFVETFLVCPYQDSVGELLNSLWVVCGGTRLKVWTNLGVHNEPHAEAIPSLKDINTGDRESQLLWEDRAEVPPRWRQELLGHISQESFVIQAHGYPIDKAIYSKARTVSVFMISLQDEAIWFAHEFKSLPYFVHALELLLHEVLETEAPSFPPAPKAALLPHVVLFLESFDESLDVIGQCARKSEYTYWSYLFSITGDAKELFQKCVTRGKLLTAITFLIIIQTMESAAVSSKLALALLEKALQVNDFNLCSELVRFLASISHANRDPQMEWFDSSPTDGAVPHESKTLPDGTDMFYIEILVNQHARRMLNAMQLRLLGKMARLLRFPLATWLERERKLRALEIPSWPAALLALHVQFDLPPPPLNWQRAHPPSPTISPQSTTRAFAFDFTIAAHGTESEGGTQEMGQPASLMKRRNSRGGKSSVDHELRFLQSTFRRASLGGHLLILSTLLLDVRSCVEILSDPSNPSQAKLVAQWLEMVGEASHDSVPEGRKGNGYIEFGEAVVGLLRLGGVPGL